MAEMTTANIANAILQDLIDHAKDFSAESALAGRMADAGCWRTVADALISLRKTHRLVPVELAEAALPTIQLLADPGVIAVGGKPISPTLRVDMQALAAALRGGS
jgi:hypothetical protein